MDKILISACLMGLPVRYDGKGKPLSHALIARWRDEGRLVVFCPEQAGGLPTPRPPAEIEQGGTGEDVLAGRARVMENTGRDASAEFIAGGNKAVELARQQNCRFALLIAGSPSCGSGFGVTAALLKRAGIAVFSPDGIDALEAELSNGS
ncbi:DUF523 domain-containing protein [Allorhizobium taibaishanense]|uniref:Purine-nucleoside phosphorylase n=1 Tax=Allorhizobium taibaishanense TaxID=887144 RepID=A0A1Q9AAD7_9HYPH|nr:DUF523 domain-containing protein [Allorhizobium taibaishanense]MBB4006970.1 uncharacterized protein YbbK (DUF523 family) [Allorhizobium taibaishanense]OLP51792.1 purine-nucleoside phosphorylase [Allorhizobium taibaishanense]